MSELHQVLFGSFVPPQVLAVRKHSIMNEPKEKPKHKFPKEQCTLKNRERLQAISDSNRAKLLAAMPKLDGLNLREICETLDMSKSCIQKHIASLLKSEQISRKRVVIPSGGFTFTYHQK